ncbi:integrase [Bacteroides clarus CAG:160]|uniref:site-specific integrase n=1 Tax=Bacteroides TaxID=816 RepID=UPI00033C5C2E|nr:MULTISPECIES: site-specific integrase [Bacteroides]CDB81882.1 integrase [Bacteroides clarus CAG:160]
MNNELKVSFYLKREGNTERTETNPDTVYPIVGKIIIGNTIAQFGSKLKIEERLWNVKSGRAIGKSRVAVELNREINKINLSIHTHYRDIFKRTGKVTAIEVKNAFQGIATAQKMLLALFGEMMEDFKGRIGIDRAQSTYKQYEVLYKQLKQFLREEYHVEDIPLTELDLSFIEALNFFFRVKRRMKPRTVKARIILLNKMIRLALHRRIITRPPFDGFELEKTELKNKSLTSDELDLLMKTPLKSGTQRFIRDMFLFSTFTGLAYADLHKLSWKDIITEDDGSLWISANRQKSHTEFNVKLLNIPIQIIEYYKGLAPDGKVFPPMSLGQVNVGLKRIARNCGINRALSFHQARYTFASQICLSQGVPIESVSRMLGHKHIETTQRYARLNNEKISNDMQQLSARLASKFNF